MSYIVMDLEASSMQAEHARADAETLVGHYDQLLAAIRDFASNGELDSQQYDSAKRFATEVVAVAAQGARELTMAVAEAVSRLPDEYRARVCEHSLREEDLLDAVLRLSDVIEYGQELVGRAVDQGMITASEGMGIPELVTMRDHAQDLLDRLRDFNTFSTTVFADIGVLKAAVDQGVAAVKTGFDARQRTFRIPSEMGWAQQIRARVVRRGEREFVEEMAREHGWDEAKARRWYSYRVQYGFSTEVIVLMARVYDGIRELYPGLSDEQVDYLWLRIIGAASYDTGGIDDWYKWGATAGFLFFPSDEDGDKLIKEFSDLVRGDQPLTTLDDLKAIYQRFGLTEEANTFYYELRLQHTMAGRTDKIDSNSIHNGKSKIDQKEYRTFKSSAEAVYGPMSDEEFDEFWDSRVGQYQSGIDFTHQAITTATEKYRSDQGGFDLFRDGSDAVSEFLTGNDLRALAGWAGDVTNDADVDPSMSDADYRADLDAVNISRRIESTGKSYQQVQEEYYAEIDAGKTNRAEEFLTHVEYEKVKSELYSMVPDDITSEEGKREHLRTTKEYMDSYNFLRSLEERSNSLKVYAEPKKDDE